MKWEDYFSILQNISSRYFIVAAIAFVPCYLLLRKWMRHKKIQPRFPGTYDYLREVICSFITMLLFAFVPLFLIKNPAIEPFTTYYTSMD